jgi:hypothetical protein
LLFDRCDVSLAGKTHICGPPPIVRFWSTHRNTHTSDVLPYPAMCRYVQVRGLELRP